MYQTAEGEPLASFYLIKTDGIFQSDADAAAYVNKDGKRIQPDAVAGDLKFVDANGDGVINDEDRKYCGSATPKTTFSFSGGFTWKKLSVSAMFQGVGGAQALYVGKYMALSDVEGNFNRSKGIMNAGVRRIQGRIFHAYRKTTRIATLAHRLIGIWRMLLTYV